MSLKADLQTQVKDAMRSQHKDRLATIRLIMAAIKQREVDERIELSDDQILAVLDKMVKQRRESITQFEKANRQDLVDKEQAELLIIQEFMPQALSEAEINEMIQSALATTGAKAMADMGKVMAVLKPQIAGRADIAQVSAKLKALLS